MSHLDRDQALSSDEPQGELQAEQKPLSSDQGHVEESRRTINQSENDTIPWPDPQLETPLGRLPQTDQQVLDDQKTLDEEHVSSDQQRGKQRFQSKQIPQNHNQQNLFGRRILSSHHRQTERHLGGDQQPQAEQQFEHEPECQVKLRAQTDQQPPGAQAQTTSTSQMNQRPQIVQLPPSDQQLADERDLIGKQPSSPGRHHRTRHRRHHRRHRQHPERQGRPRHHQDHDHQREQPGDQTSQQHDLVHRDLKSDHIRECPGHQADCEAPPVIKDLINATSPTCVASRDNPENVPCRLGDERLQLKKHRKEYREIAPSSSTDIRTREGQSSVALARLDSVLTHESPMLPDEMIVGHSTYQFMILACAHISVFMAVFHQISIHMLTRPVDHWCKPPLQYAHMSPDAWKNLSIPLEEDRYSQCFMYDPPYGLPNGTRQVVRCVEWVYDVSPATETMVSQWNLVCGNSLDLYLVAAYSLIADMLSVPVLGQISDKAGRKSVINVCIVVSVFVWVAIYFATRYMFFNIGRIFLSVVLNTLRMNMFILLFEVTTPEYRDCYINAAQFGVVVAMTTAGALECVAASKRTVLTVGMMPTSLLIFAIYAVEESPRWLVTRWEFEQARRVLKWMCRVNGTGFETPPLEKHYQVKHGKANYDLIQVTIFDLLTQSALRNRTVILGGVWFCLICSYYAEWQLNTKACDVRLLLLATVLQAAAVLLSCVLLRLCGRKASLRVVCLLSGGLAFVLSASVTLPDYLVTILRHLTLCTLLLNFFICFVYTLELYPTVMRAMGFSTAVLCGKLGSVASFLVKEQHERFHPSAPDILIAALMIGAAFLLSWLPETKYARVPDTMYDVEAQVVRNIVIKMFQK